MYTCSYTKCVHIVMMSNNHMQTGIFHIDIRVTSDGSKTYIYIYTHYILYSIYINLNIHIIGVYNIYMYIYIYMHMLTH